MLRRIKSNSRGGIVLFLCIILSALILSQTILLQGILMRSNETEITRAAHLQSENVLCSYNRTLLENYGIYCFDDSALNRSVFDQCCRVQGIESVDVCGVRELQSEDLGKIINDYMKFRFPTMMGNGLLKRIGSAVGTINKSNLKKEAIINQSELLKTYLSEYLSSSENWDGILENAENFIDFIDYSDKLSDFKAFIKDLRETAKRAGTLKLQGNDYSSFSVDLFDPESIDKVLDVLSYTIEAEVPEYYSYLYINKYAASLFDSNLEKIKDGSQSFDESNIYGTAFSEINGANKADLEYLLTGKEGKTAVNLCKTFVFSSRAAINLGTFLLDRDKMSIAEGIAGIVAACIAIVSGGTVSIDPAVAKYLVIATWALKQSFEDLKKLTDGGTIPVIVHSSLNEQEGLKALLETSYRDYLEIFMMFVDREILLSRMIDVFRRYTGGKLYVSVQTNVNYSGKRFRYEECYDSYK
ncbi:MAG: hypothetical protein JW780_02010 [Clostridiales bacterium]|nr:hypothetical protein [Clostridiales bacterium]